MLDKIYLKTFFHDYKERTIADAASSSFEAAETAFVFMTLAYFLHAKTCFIWCPRITRQPKLHNFICWIVKELKTIGFRVITVKIEINSINKKTMSHFASTP